MRGYCQAEALGLGAVPIVSRLDRLARFARDLLDTLSAIRERKAISGPWATYRRAQRHRTGFQC
jgi:hypothetical protein